jgi:hypothetical protein
MPYVIKRTDQKGGYVARPGSSRSYVKRLRDARQFKTREEALNHRCPGNEVVCDFEEESKFNALALGQRNWEER